MSSIPNGSYTRSNGAAPASNGVIARFYIEAVEDPVATAEQGRPIYRNIERVALTFPGNPWSKPVQNVNDSHRIDYAVQYERFKKGLEMAPDGTPLEEWSILNPARVLELKALGFFTVENIASAPDAALQRIGMGYFGLRDRAKAFLDDADAVALTEKLTFVNEGQAAEISSLNRQLAELKSQVDRMFANQMAQGNAPNPLAIAVPFHSDPLAQQQYQPQAQPPQPSSLADLPARRRPGRPAKAPNEAAA